MNQTEMQVHYHAIEVGRHYRRCEARLIEVLQTVEQMKLYKKLECSSLFVYAVQFLGLDESLAYSSITVARKAREIPRLGQSIKNRKLSIAKANRIVSALTSGNAVELIEFAESHPTAEVNRESARRRREAGLGEELRSVRVSAANLGKIKRARDLMSKNLDLDQTLGAVLDEHLERHDPVRKAVRLLKQPNSVRTELPGRRKFTAQQKHTVFARDQGRCTHIDKSGGRCTNERFLHVHHIQPVSQGGTNHPENLTTLCSFHHDLAHQLSLPIDGQVTWLREKQAFYLKNPGRQRPSRIHYA